MLEQARKIECLDRLERLTGGMLEIVDFLVEEKILKHEYYHSMRKSPIPAKELERMLNELKKDNILQLLEYEWIVLPKESIKVTIVTDNAKREFTYAAF